MYLADSQYSLLTVDNTKPRKMAGWRYNKKPTDGALSTNKANIYLATQSPGAVVGQAFTACGWLHVTFKRAYTDTSNPHPWFTVYSQTKPGEARKPFHQLPRCASSCISCTVL